MNYKLYFKLRLKKAFKIFPAILVITTITMLCLAAACVFIIKDFSNNADKQKVSVAITGDANDEYFDGVFDAVKEMDNSRFFLDLQKMTEQEAEKKLNERKISGYVVIPENFVEGIYYGNNIPAKYYTLVNSGTLGSFLTFEVAEVMSKLVVETQMGVYSLQKFAYANDMYDQIDNNIVELNLKFVNNVIGREKIYERTVLGVSDSLSTEGYYICAALLLFLLLWGVSCNKILDSGNLELSRLLEARGMKTWYQLLCEYGAYLITTTVMLFMIFALFGAVTVNNSFTIEELKTFDISAGIFYVIKILPVVVMITLMHMAFYEFMPDTVSGVLIQIIVGITLAYISGCFYPIYFFPDAVQNFSEILPSGAAFSYLKKSLSETLTIKDFVLPIVYTLFFAMIIFLRRKNRLEGEHK